LWLWVHTPGDRKSSAVLFGAMFFLAFSVHYYSALCLVPYAAFEAFRWKPWRAPSPKLLAGGLGILSGVALFSGPILAASTISKGFWAPPRVRVLLEVFGDFFPYGLFLIAAALMWIAWSTRPEVVMLDPMPESERLGWYFFLMPIAGFVAAKLVTNAFYNRYFIGVLPGVALAFACALWRHFRHRPGLSAGIVLGMLSLGVGHQIYTMTRSWAIEPPSNGGGTAKLKEALEWEGDVLKDGKKNIAVAVDGLIGLEARYYSKHPERYAFVATPHMGVVARTNRNLSQYQPMRFWSVEDLRAAARDTALMDPTDEMLQPMIDAGFKVKQLPYKEIRIIYLE
jgi:hypothetical protein